MSTVKAFKNLTLIKFSLLFARVKDMYNKSDFIIKLLLYFKEIQT